MKSSESTGGVSILIVEDEADLREILVEELRVRGWRVMEADTGPAALELTKQFKFDLIISDIRMPGFGGVELVKKLKSEITGFALPQFIFITGFSDFSESEVRGIGAKAVFQKPFRIREMITCVESLLKNLPDA